MDDIIQEIKESMHRLSNARYFRANAEFLKSINQAIFVWITEQMFSIFITTKIMFRGRFHLSEVGSDFALL